MITNQPNDTKKRGIVLLSIPRSEALALPIWLNRQHQSPRRYE